MPLTQLVCWPSCRLQLKCAAGQIRERVFASMVGAQQAALANEPAAGSRLGRDLAGSNAGSLEPCRLLSNPCDQTSVTSSPAQSQGLHNPE